MPPEGERFALVILSPGKAQVVVTRMIPVVNLITKPDLGGLPPKPPTGGRPRPPDPLRKEESVRCW